MTRLFALLAAVAVVGGAVAVSRTFPTAADTDPTLKLTPGDKNPWTSSKLNNAADQFQFAVVSDRTGGHRAKIFSTAVERVNLLQPEFVMSVGDLIEGYTQKEDVIKQQWDEFDSYTAKFQMPFFLVPGNHDLTNQTMTEYWGGRYGKTYYHFVYKNALFVAVNSEDGKASTLKPEQVAAVKKALDENKGVRWTFVFLHKPLWTEADLAANGWGPVEEALAGRKYTVFCGHVHRYQKFVRNGMNYYQLATTGGGSKLRGPEYGEFDHFTWVTMKADGPVLANVLLDGVLPEDLKVPTSAEEGVPVKKLPTVPVSGTVTLDGKPLAGAVVVFDMADPPQGVRRVSADGVTDAAGKFRLATYGPGHDGAPAGEYGVGVRKSAGGLADEENEKAKSSIPEHYARSRTSGLKATVTAAGGVVNLDLKSK
jgi:serine/threonine-protein phosphatase CPPED1